MADAQAVLVRAVERALGQDKQLAAHARLRVASLHTTPWVSATFAGQSHRLKLELNAPEGSLAALASRVADQLDDADLPLPGHALVEMKLLDSRCEFRAGGGGACEMLLSALTVED